MLYAKMEDLKTDADIKRELDKIQNDKNLHPIVKEFRIRILVKRYDKITGDSLYNDLYR